MRIAITGSKGQLGLALQATLKDDVLLPMDLPEYDITDLNATLAALAAFEPDVVINTAAITDVDGCERNPDLAYRVNCLGARNLAVAALQTGAAMVQVSTDYVFGGRTEPYREYDATEPLSIYALTKWQGEQVVRDHLQRFYVVRTAWMYGQGPRNFVETVLRLANERGQLTMVTDEVGSPTYALDLARALGRLIRTPAYGVHHLAGSGVCSRHAWACEILRLAGREDVAVAASTNYQRLARVPKHVELANVNAASVGVTMPAWQDSLAAYMRERHG